MLIKDYYTLTKPGIIYGNAITAIAGFILASRGDIDYFLLGVTVIGLSFVIASGCVLNNVIDRDIDRKMERTKERAIARGSISVKAGLIYGAILGIGGLSLLAIYTNILTVSAALLGLFVYIVLYSMWLKRSSTHSAIIGSISGAIPLLVGYLAVHGQTDMGAVILFFVLALWQMPHAFAIAIYRLEDYKNASIPVLPLERGIYATKVQMFIYASLFLVATLLLSLFGYTGRGYFYVMLILGSLWLLLCAEGFYNHEKDDRAWARNVFGFSIIILIVFCVMVTISTLTA